MHTKTKTNTEPPQTMGSTLNCKFNVKFRHIMHECSANVTNVHLNNVDVAVGWLVHFVFSSRDIEPCCRSL